MGYLSKPKEFRHRDPELFDWLRQVVPVEKDRRTARIEGADLLGAAVFQSKILNDRHNDRLEYSRIAQIAWRVAIYILRPGHGPRGIDA